MTKNILITGGGSGLGKAIALSLAKEKNNNIFITYKNSKKEAEDLCNKFPNITNYYLDLNNPSSIEMLFRELENQKIKLDVVINNAGISNYSLLIDENIDSIQNTLNTNLLGAILCSQNAIKNMLKQKHGMIINISSIWGLYGASCESIYSASKGGIIAFTKSIAKEYGLSNITSIAIAPGPIQTKMMQHFNEEELKDIANNNSISKIAKPEEIAELIKNLIDSNSAFYNGHIFEFSGTLI